MQTLKTLMFYCSLSWLLTAAAFLCPADAALSGLIRVDELNALTGTNYRIIDARPVEEWRRGHLPDAVSLSWEDYTETDAQGVAYRRLPNATIAARLGQLGIDENTPLIVYGDADSSWGGEGWVCWLLSYLGHVADIYLLDGGVQAWQQKFELKKDVPAAPTRAAIYLPHPQVGLDMTTAELMERKADIQLVDTRSFFEWWRVSLPGSIRIDWTHFFTADEHRPISKAELLSLLTKHGIDPQKPVVYYCSGGIRSAYAWTVHELAGLPPARNYEGGMEAWKMSRDYGK